jgi:hypothetical protein
MSYYSHISPMYVFHSVPPSLNSLFSRENKKRGPDELDFQCYGNNKAENDASSMSNFHVKTDKKQRGGESFSYSANKPFVETCGELIHSDDAYWDKENFDGGLHYDGTHMAEENYETTTAEWNHSEQMNYMSSAPFVTPGHKGRSLNDYCSSLSHLNNNSTKKLKDCQFISPNVETETTVVSNDDEVMIDCCNGGNLLQGTLPGETSSRNLVCHTCHANITTATTPQLDNQLQPSNNNNIFNTRNHRSSGFFAASHGSLKGPSYGTAAVNPCTGIESSTGALALALQHGVAQKPVYMPNAVLCNFCTRAFCSSRCVCNCEECGGVFCNATCSTLNYSTVFAKTLCLDCNASVNAASDGGHYYA